MIIVNKGVKEFNIPASELSMPVCALAKRNAGATHPMTPINTRYFHSLTDGLRNLLTAMGAKNKNEITIRKAPTSALENTVRLFLMSMNEVPHTKVNMSNIPQANILLSGDDFFEYIKLHANISTII